jgi:hypothetical protein
MKKGGLGSGFLFHFAGPWKLPKSGFSRNNGKVSTLFYF